MASLLSRPKHQQLQLSDKEITQFSRAQARLHSTKQYKGLLLENVSSITERGYSIGLAIFLAYSGLEALASAMGEPAYSWQLEDQTLAISLNHLLNGLDLNHPDQQDGINWLLNSPALIRRLQTFQAGENRDVLLIARSLRHMVAHGSFTTHGLKMFTKRECEAVEQLRQVIFQVCEHRLTTWLDEQLKSRTRS